MRVLSLLLGISQGAAFAATEDASALFQTTESGNPLRDRAVKEKARLERQGIARKSKVSGARATEEARRLVEPGYVAEQARVERQRVARNARGENEAATEARRLAVKSSRVAVVAAATKQALERKEQVNEELRQKEVAEQNQHLDHTQALRTGNDAAMEARISEREVQKLHAEVLAREQALLVAKAVNVHKLARRHKAEQMTSWLLTEAASKLEQNEHGIDDAIDDTRGMLGRATVNGVGSEFAGFASQAKRFLADSMGYYLVETKAAVEDFVEEVHSTKEDIQPLMARFIDETESLLSKQRADVVKRVGQLQKTMPVPLQTFLSEPLRMVEDAPMSFGINTAQLAKANNTEACDVSHDALEQMSSFFKQYSEAHTWLNAAATQAYSLSLSGEARGKAVMLFDMVTAGYVVTIGMEEAAQALTKTALPIMAKHLRCKEHKEHKARRQRK